LLKRLFWSAYLAYHLRGQAGFPFKPREEIERVTNRRVRSIAAYAFRHVPYYRETMKRLGLTPGDFATADDLAKLPIIEREQLRSDPAYFTSPEQPLDSYLRLRSSGTSGSPRVVYHDLKGVFQNSAHGERERSIYAAVVGRRYGYRETLIGASVNTHVARVQHFCQLHAFYPRGVRLERQYLSMVDSIAHNVEALNEFRPQALHCYGSYLGVLINYLQAKRIELPSPKLITYGADAASSAVRRLVGDLLHIPLFSTYASIEMLKIAFECEQHVGLHLNSDVYPIRLIDDGGRRVPEGESGQLIISNLVNRATILLNYRLGDVNRLIPEPCACGRSLPLLAFPEGRLDDWMELPDGRVVHGQDVRGVFTPETQILQFQVIQDDPTHYHILIIVSGDADRPAMARRIADRFAAAFGEALAVKVLFVDSVEMTVGGKINPVVPWRHRENRLPVSGGKV
jgi:phenylacetate-CoA ligase